MTAEQILERKKLLRLKKKPTTKNKYVGIEIECLIPPLNFESFKDGLVNEKLEEHVNVGIDSTVRGSDSTGQILHGMELRVLAEESEVPSVVNRVCGLLENLSGSVNGTCGLHVHIDMRNRDLELVYNNLIMCQDLLYKMQSSTRRKSRYCTPTEIHDAEDHYNGINKQAYRQHGTIEVRMHSGSINAFQIRMWCWLLIHIADMKVKLEKKVSFTSQLDIPDKVKAYIKRRIRVSS